MPPTGRGRDATRRRRLTSLALALVGVLPTSAAAIGSTRDAPVPVVARPTAPCFGDGVTGARIHLLYGVPADRQDDYGSKVEDIRRMAGEADRYFEASGAGTPQHFRWLCARGAPRVDRVVLAPVGAGRRYGFGDMRTSLRAQTVDGPGTPFAFRDPEHVYVVFVDGLRPEESGSCGAGEVVRDDSPGPTNRNNVGPKYSLVACWDGVTLLHEIGHNLGAVQRSAPHSTGTMHCYDERDVMCYHDRGPYFTPREDRRLPTDAGALQEVCPRGEGESGLEDRLFDCNRDDYYDPAPAPGSYLATHWNVARSAWVEP